MNIRFNLLNIIVYNLIVTLISFCIGCNFFGPPNKHCPDIAFDSGLWKENFKDRGKMVNDLINSKKLISISRDSIVNLLGAPSESDNNFMSYNVDVSCNGDMFGDMYILIEIDSVNHMSTDCNLTD